MKKIIWPLMISMIVGLVLAACTSEKIVEVEIEKIVEVEVEKIVEVEIEKIVEVEVEKIVEVEVERIIVATPTPPPAGMPKFGGTLRVVSQASVASLDMQWTGAYVTSAVVSHIQETPLGLDANISLQMRMIDSWSVSDDQLTFTFTLRDGLKFHDLSDVTASDVKASIERWLGGGSPHAGLLREYVTDEPFTVLDDKSWTVNLTVPYGLVPASFGNATKVAGIFPEKIVGGRPAFEGLESDQIIGSGVYKLAKWDVGHQIVLDRFEEYVPRDEPPSFYTGGTQAYLDTVIWLEIPDEETKIAGLETGEWDVVDGAGFDFFERLQGNSDLVVPVYKPGHRSFYGLIPSHPPFDNLKARQAALFGTNEEEVMFSFGDPRLWIMCPAIYYCGTPLETDAGADEWYNQYEPEKAKRLLDESPYAGEQWVLLNPTDYATITPVGIVVKQQLTKIGFNIDMPAYDWATVVSNLGAPETFSAWTSWGAHWSSSDPVGDSALAGTQQFWPKIPYVMDLRIQWAQETDPVKKAKLLDEVQIAAFENVYWVYLGQFFTIFPHISEYKNFEVKGMPFYANAWLER